MKQQTQMKRHEQIPGRSITSRFTIVALSLCSVFALALYANVALASVPANGSAQPAEPTATQAAPAPVESAVATLAPKPADTAQSQLNPVGTRGVGTITDAQPGDTGAAPGQGQPGGTTGGADGFPWLPVGIVGALLLAGVVFLAARSRRGSPATATVAPATTARTERPTPATTVAQAPITSSVTTTTQTQAVTPAPVAVSQPAPGPLKCPNCGTVNDGSESFCQECGQDLRRLRAQVAPVAPAAPVAPVVPVAPDAPPAFVPPATPAKPAPPPTDEVADTTPYLETVSRVDEQLEYVLAREQIVVGTAHGNDIVIDSMFAGWETVSPVHAELRREQNSFVLVDRSSEAGTFVNDERVTNVALSDGDRLRIGDVQFIFRAPSESSGDQV